MTHAEFMLILPILCGFALGLIIGGVGFFLDLRKGRCSRG
jgi:hypothetical protein